MNHSLAEMTWPDVARAVATGAATVILPLGATEQHGPHLPLGTDTFRAAALANRLAAHLPGALVAPALPIGCSDEHHGFAGLLGLDHTTLAAVIVDCARRMVTWGVRRLILLSAHGGNGQALALALERIHTELPDLLVWAHDAAPDTPTVCPPALLAVAAAEGIPAEVAGLHAGEAETSEMLYLRPDLVQVERAVAGYTGNMDAVLSRLEEAGVRAVAPSGVLGDPRPADGKRGGRYLDACARYYIQCLLGLCDCPFRQYAQQPPKGAP